MPFDIQGARAAGYSDKEIADHLAKDSKFDLAAARKAGYSDPEIIGHLSAPEAPAAKAVSPHTPEMQALIDQIPGQARADGTVSPPVPMPAPQADPTLVQKLIGGGETALALGTGATFGAAGMMAGGVAGAVNNLTNGQYGIPGGVEAGMQQGAESLTYAPRTESGQAQTEAVGKVLSNVLPATPLTMEMATAGRAAGNAARATQTAAAGAAAPVAQAATQAVERIRAAAPAIAERVQRIIDRNPDRATATAGARGSVGAAASDLADQRRQLADNMPVPLNITEGMATRDPAQIKFESEASKGPNGAPLRERSSELNEGMQKNFDAYADQTGMATADVSEAGKVVDQVLRKELSRDKAEVRTKYQLADKSPEAGALVQLDDIVQFLNDSKPDAEVSKVLGAAAKHAVKLGAAVEDDAGNLIPLPTTVKKAETLRRAINNATDYEPTNIRNSAMMKGLIDAATESVAGPLYRDARRARENLGNKWENRGIVSDLVNKKRGMNDRNVAVEDVFKHIILDGDRSELSHMRSILHKAGEEGTQAWKELQGHTVEWLKSEALKNVATDQRGNRIVSAAQLDKAIAKLEKGKKLDFIFGKAGAQQMRDINDLAKVVMTAPPSAGLNTSNTASTIAALLAESGASGAMFGVPVPVVTGTRLLLKHVKDKKLRARIEQSLNPPRRGATPPAP